MVERMGMLAAAMGLGLMAMPAPVEGTVPPVEGHNWTSPSTGMKFLWIPTMKMWVGKYEVTNGEYRQKKPEHNSLEYRGYSLNGDRQPVVYVTFDDAKQYAEWLTRRDGGWFDKLRYRLPSEQEWKNFARCGNDGWEYPWEGGKWPPRSGRAGNYRDVTAQRDVNLQNPISGYNDGFPVTAEVDKLWANQWGLHGVGGNVWEACARDSSGASFGSWRGASWSNFNQDALRISARLGNVGSPRYGHYGFRLVLSRQ